MAKEKNNKNENKVTKKKIDKSQLATRIMAGVLAGMLVIAFAATLIFCLVG